MKFAQDGLYYLHSLVIWRGIRQDPVIRAFEYLLNLLLDDEKMGIYILDNYYSFLHTFTRHCRWDVYGFSWAHYILELVRKDENIFSLYAEGIDYDSIPNRLIELADHDLLMISNLADLSWDVIVSEIGSRAGYDDIQYIFKDRYDARAIDELNCQSLAQYYRHNGCGLFSIYRGFRWRKGPDGIGYLDGIENIDPIRMDDLIGYEEQKQRLIDNTKILLSGRSANNVLLYGDKGTGKSSMVKALLNEFYSEGLRIVEVPKENLCDYYDILSMLEGRSQKFILFIDDLSFEDTEPEYKHIKALLEGGLKERPQNIVIYATSNRRHLIRQSFDDRDEVIPADAIQEKLSLSDRFGITLTFVSPSQEEYIEIIEGIAKNRGIDMKRDVLIERALAWEKLYNGRSGRTARQFIDHIDGGISNG